MNKKIITKTDREESLESNEFIWDTDVNTDVHKIVYPVLKNWLQKENYSTLLDLGCGNGSLTNLFTNLGLDVTGTDFSKSGIEIAQKKFLNSNFFQSNMEEPLSIEYHKKFDIVTSVEVIEHLLLPRQLFERAKEALKPNGTLIITTPYHGYWKNFALAVTNSFDKHWHPLRDYGHVKFFSHNTLVRLFNEQGFEVTDIKNVGRIPIFGKSMIIKGKLK